ncbi:uncharacterized protein LOC129915942 isoform X2 [Episyrphus balteatus]|uniref:uncharacterized protein LOC129915942 isoform X2 n=1 Tax=Episyrphus balteatus TaxID=286459 RepID=UPI0024865E0C|nr:uncharacterized protein LOC129915942 isoform X2 [Episyrphus balteatus]
MTDSLKLAEMQRTSIEFERQRHLANWFIKSSPHMATPTSPMNGSGAPSTNGAANSSSSTTQQQQQQIITTSSGNGTKNGTITTTNPLFFIMPNSSNGNHHHSSSHHQASATVAVTAANVVGNSSGGGATPSGKQTGVGVGGGGVSASSHHSHHHPGMGAQEGRKPKLRRFNSHDTSANMFSVADFENARLARRNEIELKQRMQQQRMKMNSLSSGGDCSTGDSKGSKYSNDSQTDPLPAEVFLDRYSLPRVVRISYKMKFSHETLQSSSSNGSSTSTQSSTASSSASVGQSNNNNNNNHHHHNQHHHNANNGNGNNNNKSNSDFLKENGELFLLYRLIQQRHIYHGHNAKTGVAHRKKGVMIPQEFPGYFSLINEKGVPTATLYTTLIQLVRERVYKFVSVDNLPAFTESQSAEGYAARPQYIKTTARGGQVFRLLAVFEDGKQQDSSASSNKISSNSGREKEKGRYAQLLNENRQVLYVSLSTKGKFYEIEPGVPQILQKINSNSEAQSKKVNPDCVHRITALIAPNKELPMTIRYISGPTGTANSIPENLTISRITMENVVIACPIESVEAQNPLHLRKLHITPEMILVKYLLGFENEQRMLANQNVQNILKFCQFNCDQFLKMVEVEVLHRPERSGSKSRVDGLKILKPLNFPKLLRREKTSIAHEKEDSIIFLSKNDLANMEAKDEQKQSSSSGHNRISEKMKVFQSTKKKWFRRNDKHTSLTSLDLDVQAKRMSMERYNDMSKMLQERFGANLETESISERSTSEIGITDQTDSKKPPLQKSLSLQEVDLVGKPDLLPKNFTESNDTMNDHEQDYDGDGDVENKPPQSFITQKLYTEFYVKTRQYSKSSSSLHQLLHFSVPQKMNVIETKNKNQLKEPKTPTSKKLEFNIGEEVTTTGFNAASPSAILDDLPYSSVRDSLLLSSDESSNELCSPNPANMALNLIDHTKENIYAEICHGDTVTITNANSGFRIESFSTNNQTTSTSIGVSDYGSVAGPSAVSRVQINCSNSPVLGSRPNINRSSTTATTTVEEDNIYNTLK